MNIRHDFEVLKNNPNYIYVDSACMSLRPTKVVNKILEYYNQYPVCAGRSNHALSNKLNIEIKLARKVVRKFINARSEEEIVFTKNTTEGLNLVAESFGLCEGDAVLIGDKEHNSNLVPWLRMRDKGIKVLILKTNDDGTFNMSGFQSILDRPELKLISLHYSSNVDGVEIPVKEITKLAHSKGIKVLIDAAQAAPHKVIDVKDLDVDFLAFSGHKMMGPSGIGVLYGKKEALDKLQPFLVGGETVKDTTHSSVEYETGPEKFEAGLQHYGGIVGLGEACKYLMKIGLKKIAAHEIKLNQIITEGLKNEVTIIGPQDAYLRGGIFNFYIEGMDMHNFATILDSSARIMTRSGQHCVHSYYNDRKLPVSCRISLYAYNTEEEAKKIVEEVKETIRLLK